MADFCKQCSEELFGFDGKDLRGLITVKEWEDKLDIQVICEGCGVTRVDPEGACISTTCKEEHGIPK